jgi:multicomponent Na+:H+ antiporter subunit E
VTRSRVTGLAVVVWLTAVWVLLWGTASVANVLGGVVVAVLIRLLLPLPVVPTEGRIRPLPVLRLAVRVAVDLVVSSADVAWLSVRPGGPPRTSITSVQLSTRSDLVLSLVVSLLNLQPGAVVLEVDAVQRRLYVHVLAVEHRDARPGDSNRRLRRSALRLEELLDRSFAAPRDPEPRDPEPYDLQEAP